MNQKFFILQKKKGLRINVGCGSRPFGEGWVDCDLYPAKGVDIAFDAQEDWPFNSNSATEIYASHVLEHMQDPVKFMLEAERVLEPLGIIRIRVPYGNNVMAMSDPTHVRPYHVESFVAYTRGYAENTFNLQHEDSRWPHEFCILEVVYNMNPFWNKFPNWIPWALKFKKWIAENFLNACQELTILMQKVPKGNYDRINKNGVPLKFGSNNHG